ncbi:hypothetical protein [Lactobacillus sp. 3B(2020)]|uniref:hypothetical protein n=1 Tax=Lactobacillus sp. 3B(2020) TaxID=2695882 RepID=UPI0015E057D1|nr:hypothetical protein [Lactobacillus sp. 3B(2020)]QLL70166.1 hypothetical protein GTO83_06265 [Lactobacillus sp. 3B(2020)]
MSILIALLVIWILWKLFKFSLWLLGVILVITLAAAFFKLLLVPAILLLGLACFGLFNH